MSDATFLLTVAALASAGTYVVARRGWRLAPGGLRPALLRLLEWAGLVALFYALDVAVGLLVVAVLRRLTTGFVSAYMVGDGTLVALSALQAVVLQWWRAEGERPPR